MIVIENMPPPQPQPALVAPAPASSGSGQYEVVVPDRIPAHCIEDSGNTYDINPLVLLSVLKVESNGRTGIVSTNTDGSADLGPSQFNTRSWAKVLIQKYNIPREALIHDMCQATRALGFALRTEINAAGGSLWEGIGNYHSHTPKYHNKYIGQVYAAYRQMTTKGKF